MTAVQSLGARLKEQREHEAAAALAEEEQKARAAQVKAQAELDIVIRFFETAKSSITQAILGGEKMPRIVLGGRSNSEVYSLLRGYSWNEAKQHIDSPQHAYHAVWAEFKQWAQENDLDVAWCYEWDGGGVESWHTLTINPL